MIKDTKGEWDEKKKIMHALFLLCSFKDWGRRGEEISRGKKEDFRQRKWRKKTRERLIFTTSNPKLFLFSSHSQQWWWRWHQCCQGAKHSVRCKWPNVRETQSASEAMCLTLVRRNCFFFYCYLYFKDFYPQHLLLYSANLYPQQLLLY